MTAPATGPGGAPPVDRRWFEEALRSQGFVVEPPPDDDPEADQSAGPAASPAVTEPVTPLAEPVVERPPMPSALLARIAARGQPAPATASEPEDVAEPGPEPVAASVVPAALATERPAPWASAVVATVAPWSPPPEPVTTPEAPEPRPTEPDAPPPPIESTGSEPVAEDGHVRTPEPEPESAPPMLAADPPAEAPSTVLDSPYAPAPVAAVATATRVPPATTPAAPEASEGELWALVGATEQAATKAPGSEATRIILTILTAFLILVIVVGSLVLASQIA